MGKAARWFRNLFNIKSPDPNPKNPKDKRTRSSSSSSSSWAFIKSYREKDKEKLSTNAPLQSYRDPQGHNNNDDDDDDEANKHAMAVAAATAAVAEAAVAAAQAAAAVVRLTNSGRCNAAPPTAAHVSGERNVWEAAVVIQSHFRSYLARRALRALKGLVKLQAHVRGHIMRRKTAETMRCMQAMLRAQARARSIRAYIPESPLSSSKSCQLYPGPTTPEKFELVARSAKQDQSPKIRRNSSRSSRLSNTNLDKANFGSSWSDPRMEEPTWDPRVASSTRTCLTDDDRADRILEIDTGKPHYTLRRRNLFESSHSGLLTSDQVSHSYTTSKDSTTHQTIPSPVSCEVVQSLNPLKFSHEVDDGPYCTAENSPQVYSAGSQGGSSRRGPFTPAKSDGSRSFLSGYSDCPSYMSYTESAKAKMRSLSAPKQRPQYERVSSTKRYSVHGFGEHNPRLSGHKASAMHASFASKAYPGSGRLDRLGMPVKDSTVVYYSGYLN